MRTWQHSKIFEYLVIELLGALFSIYQREDNCVELSQEGLMLVVRLIDQLDFRNAKDSRQGVYYIYAIDLRTELGS